MHTRNDLESQYYMGRHLAQVGQAERAISVLSSVLDQGFLCGSALARDSSFALLRSSPAFADLVRHA